VVAHLKTCRDTLVPQLQALPQVRVEAAKGGMYAFFKLDGFDDSLAVAKRWWPRPGWAWRPAMRSRPRRRAGCAGALRPRTWHGWGRAWSVWRWLDRQACIGRSLRTAVPRIAVKPLWDANGSGYNSKALHPARRTLGRSSSPNAS
jgi:hypothetical protein